ncbi:MAG: S24 family peptidase [Alistipes sp.]|nr:S24 family peptidase [Alistipes sp.]
MNLTKKEFELASGLSNGYLNNCKGNVGAAKLEGILTAYPQLNRTWLLTGEGEMLVADTTPHIVETSIVSNDEEIEVDIDALMREWHTLPENFANIIGENIDFVRTCKGKLLPRHIIKLQSHYGDTVVDKYTTYTKIQEVEIIESFPVLPEDVTTSPNTDVLKYVEENGSELETINPSQLLTDAKVDVAERIKRTSMLPTFQPEDTVFIRFIKDKMKIVDGETYYLDCKNRPTMIRLVKFEGCDKLRLIAKNPQYGDIIIERSDIINIGVVVALFRMTFGDQYAEIEAIRRHKDEQLEERNQQINSFIDIQREMIAEIRESGKRNDRLIDKLMEK